MTKQHKGGADSPVSPDTQNPGSGTRAQDGLAAHAHNAAIRAQVHRMQAIAEEDDRFGYDRHATNRALSIANGVTVIILGFALEASCRHCRNATPPTCRRWSKGSIG